MLFRSKQYCLENGILILEKIPYDEELGRLNADGLIAVRQAEPYRRIFEGLLHRIENVVKG